MIKSKKRGQFQIGFGMIFSIFLIVCFIVVAFIAINFFLKMGCTSQEGNLLNDLQKRVDEIWSGAGVESFSFKAQISENCGIKEICFYNSQKDTTTSDTDYLFKQKTDTNGNSHNFYFYPQKKSKIDSVYIKHINLEKLEDNPYCIKLEEGIVKISLSKGIREDLVRVN